MQRLAEILCKYKGRNARRRMLLACYRMFRFAEGRKLAMSKGHKERMMIPIGEGKLFLQAERLMSAFGTLRVNARRSHYVKAVILCLPYGQMLRRALQNWQDYEEYLKLMSLQIGREKAMRLQASEWHFRNKGVSMLNIWYSPPCDLLCYTHY